MFLSAQIIFNYTIFCHYISRLSKHHFDRTWQLFRNSFNKLLKMGLGPKLKETRLEFFVEKNSDGSRHLRLKGNELFQRYKQRLDAEDMKKIAVFLLMRPKITSLNICYNNIGDQGLINLTNFYFLGRNKLKHLNMMNCDITFKGLKVFCDAYNNLELETLEIGGNKIGSKGGDYVAKILEDVPSLKTLRLGDTDQTLMSVDSILNKARQCHLTVLDVSRVIPKNPYDKLDPQWLAKNIGLFLETDKHLKEMHAQKCEFDGHDIEKMLLGLSRNQTLLFLDIGANNIGCYGAQILAEWLKTRPPILALDISSNQIKESGARALSFGLPYSKIRHLNISNNRIEDAGMAFILHTLKKSHIMRLFYLWGNPFGQRTLKIIQRMLTSGVLDKEYIDIRLYEVDGVLQYAFYGTNHYKHRYYCVMDHGTPGELIIKKNDIEEPGKMPRCLLRLLHFDRFPPLPKKVKKRPPDVEPCVCKICPIVECKGQHGVSQHVLDERDRMSKLLRVEPREVATFFQPPSLGKLLKKITTLQPCTCRECRERGVCGWTHAAEKLVLKKDKPPKDDVCVCKICPDKEICIQQALEKRQQEPCVCKICPDKSICPQPPPVSEEDVEDKDAKKGKKVTLVPPCVCDICPDKAICEEPPIEPPPCICDICPDKSICAEYEKPPPCVCKICPDRSICIEQFGKPPPRKPVIIEKDPCVCDICPDKSICKKKYYAKAPCRCKLCADKAICKEREYQIMYEEPPPPPKPKKPPHHPTCKCPICYGEKETCPKCHKIRYPPPRKVKSEKASPRSLASLKDWLQTYQKSAPCLCELCADKSICYRGIKTCVCDICGNTDICATTPTDPCNCEICPDKSVCFQ